MVLFSLIGCTSNKAKENTVMVYEPIEVDEVKARIASMKDSKNIIKNQGFVLDGYIYYEGKGISISDEITETEFGSYINPKIYARLHDPNTDEINIYGQQQFIVYDSNNLEKRIDVNKKHKIYLGVYSHRFREYYGLGSYGGYSYSYELFVDKIEGLLTDEEIAEIERQEAIKKETDRRISAEKILALDKKGEEIAAGYIYHGIAESDKNYNLFKNGALEVGHAYFLTNVQLVYGGTSIGRTNVRFLSDRLGDIIETVESSSYVDFVNQKIKGELVNAGNTNVIVAGGKYRPSVLGIVAEN